MMNTKKSLESSFLLTSNLSLAILFKACIIVPL